MRVHLRKHMLAMAGIGMACMTQAATWNGGSGMYSDVTRWTPMVTPCFETLPVSHDVVIDVAGSLVDQDVPLCSVETLTLGAETTLRLLDGTDYTANGASVAGVISGLGGDLTAAGASFAGSSARISAASGSQIELDAGTLDASSVPFAGVPVLSASGVDSVLSLPSLVSIDASFDSFSSSANVQLIRASDGGDVSLPSLVDALLPVDVEDRLSFEVSGSSALDLNALATTSGGGQVLFNASDSASLNLPALSTLTGARFFASGGAQITAAGNWTIDTGNLSNNSYVLVEAADPGSLLDLSGLTMLDTSFDSLNASAQTHSVVVSDGGSVDLSGLASVMVPIDVEDRLTFDVGNSGSLDLDALAQSSGPGQLLFNVTDGGALDLPALDTLSATRFFASSGGQLTAGASTWTVDTGSLSNNNYVLFQATDPGSLLDLSGLIALDASFDSFNASAQVHSVVVSGGGSIDLSGLVSVVTPLDREDRLTFDVSNTGVLDLGGFAQASGNGQILFAASDGASLDLPALDALAGGRFFAFGGGQVSANSSTWTIDSSNLLNNNYTLIEAADPGSMLDLSGLTQIDASFDSINASAQTHFVIARDSAAVDLSGLVEVTVPADVEDRLWFEVAGTASLNLDGLQIAGGGGQVVFNTIDGASLFLPSLNALSAGRFFASSGAHLVASDSSWSLNSVNLNNNNYDLIVADDAGTLLDLSGMHTLNAGFNSFNASVQRHAIIADAGASIDLAGVDHIIAPQDAEDLLRFTLTDGATLALGPLDSVSNAGRVEVNLDPAGVTLRFPRSLDASAQVSVVSSADNTVEVVGALRFAHTDETAFDLETARVSVASADAATIEVGGTDEDTTPAASPNFGFAQLIVGSAGQTTVARLVDRVDNGNGYSLCSTDGEALYLYGFDAGLEDGLRVLNSSTLDLGGVNLYAAVGGVLMHINPMLTPGLPFPWDEGFLVGGNPADSDEDGVPDIADNCVLTANPGQEDTDADGYGNACDADLNGDLSVNSVDLGELKTAFFSSPGAPNWNPDADFNSDGFVNPIDLGIMKALFFAPPGPSCVATR